MADDLSSDDADLYINEGTGDPSRTSDAKSKAEKDAARLALKETLESVVAVCMEDPLQYRTSDVAEPLRRFHTFASAHPIDYPVGVTSGAAATSPSHQDTSIGTGVVGISVVGSLGCRCSIWLRAAVGRIDAGVVRITGAARLSPPVGSGGCGECCQKEQKHVQEVKGSTIERDKTPVGGGDRSGKTGSRSG